ncbi:TPA: hypothetical protein P7236_006392 [Pseudomonas aeruginosa]|uniref:hypothetical protein n=1 Tax=Pseudomonas aeruginosa TaxID=287 RepID=UPI001268A21E|nr:hypothetical protein [Pseudomonas aeruginosa]HBO2216388.1 hypothetical protein [Pseudomonas aeruginosa]HBO5334938.1 hypothetical protein [Pseudomonas aeruginosa]HBO6281658.1 hypothetical protein [Pseudomonas aeruginosa]HBO7627858.1 hypothetical protein [Pseudomonas aeruginosa]HBO7641040.1 hypothetical protein [Pseudomonas aeruginosa]
MLIEIFTLHDADLFTTLDQHITDRQRDEAASTQEQSEFAIRNVSVELFGPGEIRKQPSVCHIAELDSLNLRRFLFVLGDGEGHLVASLMYC